LELRKTGSDLPRVEEFMVDAELARCADCLIQELVGTMQGPGGSLAGHDEAAGLPQKLLA